MTVKEIADKCGVSEQSIRAWCRRNNVPKVPQAAESDKRKVAKPSYLITDEVAERICVYYAVYNNLQESETEETSETQGNGISETSESNETADTTLISALQAQIDTLQQHNALLSEQLSVKDNQIAMQADQIKTLTDSLRDTTAALTAAQALHAGTIQQQLTDKQVVSEDVSESVSEPEQPEQQGFFKRIFRR